MPISQPIPEREKIYFRRVEYTGYRRDDALWDVEARFRDMRMYDFPCVDRGGTIPAGEVFHDIMLRLTFDDDLVVRGLETSIDAFPYKQCPFASVVFKNVKGLKISKGFSKELRRRIPAEKGCAHLFSLLVGAAGAAFQTAVQIRMMKYCRGVTPDPLDGCLAWDSSGEMVKQQWPDFYREKENDPETE
jgi:hypothetical protein